MAEAEVSLATEDAVNSIKVGDDAFTVIRDSVNREQWYYVPDRPRLVEVTLDGSKVPEFHLVRYQFADPAAPANELSGGILQFSITLDLPAATIESLRQAIAQQSGAPVASIRLAPLPLKEANVDIYTPKGKILTDETLGAGVASTLASQKMVFSVSLTQIGADVYKELVNGTTGVPVSVSMKYGGLTPPAGFKVTVDWDRTYQHYSENRQFAAKASYFGLFTAEYHSSASDISNVLQTNKCIHVDVIEGSGFKLQDFDKYLQPILARINAEIVESMRPPETITPAEAGQANAQGFFGGVDYRVAMKKATDVRHGTEVVQMTARSYEVRATRADGFVGIGRYPEALRASRLVTTVPAGQWDKAYLALPDIFAGSESLVGANITVSLVSGAEVLDSKLARWKRGGAWIDAQGRPMSAMLFPLLGYRQRLGDAKYKSLTFRVETKLSTPDDTIPTVEMLPVFSGERPLASLQEAFERISIDGAGLPWKGLGEKGDVEHVDISLTAGGATFVESLAPLDVDGVLRRPRPAQFYIPRTVPEQAVVATITRIRGGQRSRWVHSGEDLRKLRLRSIVLDSADGTWREEGK